MPESTRSRTSSGYIAINEEANFGRLIRYEVRGGMHIAPEFITYDGKRFYAIRWFHGLPRHDKIGGTRFPHGLMMFGESLLDSARRLVGAQLGMKVRSVKILTLESYKDSEDHWHIEPEVLALASGRAKRPRSDTEIVTFDLGHTPEMAFWKSGQFKRFMGEYL